jgi:Tol biopolymer transport system component
MKRLGLAIALLSGALLLSAQDDLKVDAELVRIKSDTALLIPSQAVDEHPVWSPDGRYLAANVEGAWYRVDLATVRLDEAAWRNGQPIGVAAEKAALEAVSEDSVSGWIASAKVYPRKFVGATGTLELKEKDMSTMLVITRKGRRAEQRWQSNMENCHSIVPSPDGKHIAFICEMNGVVLMRWPSAGA